jgi:hypothetical protein
MGFFQLKRTIFSQDAATDAAIQELADSIRDTLVQTGSSAPTTATQPTLYYVDTANDKMYVNTKFPLPAAEDTDWHEV